MLLQTSYFSSDKQYLAQLCRSLSVFQLGIPTLRSQQMLEKPSHIDGLVDTAHLERLRIKNPARAAELVDGSIKFADFEYVY